MKRAAMILSPLIVVATFAAALRFGTVDTTWSDVWGALTGETGDRAQMLRDFRLPRSLIALVIGAHFAVAGMMMQISMRNPLADPTIFGVSGGAACAITGVMFLAPYIGLVGHDVRPSMDYLPAGSMQPIALTGAVLATLAVLALGRRAGFAAPRTVLIGVMMGVVLNGLVMGLVLALPVASSEMAIIWVSGALYGRNMNALMQLLPWTALGVVLTLWWVRRLAVLRFDPDMAQSLGLDDTRLRPMAMLTAAGLAASAVAVAGPVGFVGLIVPHAVRIVAGVSLPAQLWLNTLLGAALVTGADTLGRVMFAPIEVPVGIVTSLIAAPVFIALLRLNLKG